MSDKKSATCTERRLRFRRHRKNEKAVSPVVATLILILIAVAAAAALYLWLTGWQGGVTKSIGSPTIPSNLKFSIGGSTTVYPLSQIAINWFEQNNTNTNITDQQGGSVAGAEAYCAGQVEVGAASTSFTQAQLTGDGCSSALSTATVQTVVAVDAIVGIVATTNPGIGTHSVYQIATTNVSFNATTYYALYALSSSTVPSTNTGTFPGQGSSSVYQVPPWLCGPSAPAAWTSQKPAVGNPGHVDNYENCPAVGAGKGLNWSNIPFPAGCNNAVAPPTANACTYPFGNGNVTTTYDRQDSSGTEQGFSQKYLQIPKDGSGNSCGTDNQLESCKIIATHHEEGNPALAAGVAGDKNAIGFCSYGQAIAQPGLILAGYSNDIGSGNSLDTIAQQGGVVFPSVVTVLQDGYRGVSPSAAYGPWRVLEYLTDGTPTPGSVISNYINFVLGPEVNLNLATETGYISLYAA